MTLGPSPVERLNRARADLRMGVPVVIVAAGEVLVVAAAETLEAERLAAFRALGSPVVGLTARRAEVLKIAAYDGDLVRIALPSEADVSWIRDLADPSHDLSRPMKGPFRAERAGDAAPMRAALALIKSAHLLPAAVAVTLSRAETGLTHLVLAELPALLAATTPFHPVAAARVPLAAAEAGRVHVFRPEAGGEDHYAIEIGSPDRHKPVLARLHSACFTGDVLGSLKCDCGAQLAAALAQMAEEGAGVLLYLNQEGRGIGLANKMRAYSLQDQGFDTVEANHRLGFEDDERDFRIGAEILKRMGFTSVRLLTNNPAKITMMERAGVAVAERVPLKVGQTRQNAAYLATKAKKSGHLL
ncbi:GTP cyclohydrolase II [Frigidibacter sp. RF13]|uniref:GTP cyclohydrolase II n=1 Tax=Frigidibacter sp. RF13 TaxID=2997340 RepID=UPI00226EAEAC|nr:GTP cyclohydrolase II [Frigidibacter sp. RF13]MCY1128382.1 GTP cyclohydrolase II [Frigidibacter sp. RF13]